MRESEAGEKKPSGKAESFPSLFYSLRNALTVSGLGDFVVKAPLQNYKNNIPKPIKMGAKKGRKLKEIKSKNGQ